MKGLGERLLSRKTMVGECWRFAGAHDKDGYGRVSYRGRNETAHRASWIAFRGDPGDEHVLHLDECGYRDCFNPAHLMLGSHQLNMEHRDTWGAGIRGERSPKAILTAEQVSAASAQRQAGSTWPELAQQYHVSVSTIRHAVTGRTWKHLERV